VNPPTADQHFGLALSGGGFRAVLYHLGVIRFLRDVKILPQVTHITSVSGGSVIGAHLALNWDRYCGTEAEFDSAATELLRFLELDVRNRIVRRFPLTALVNAGRRVVRLDPKRHNTRTGLLERHYERFLYGDTGLFQLPESPHLYMLATNLNEGSLCAFHRDGMLLQRRSRGGREVHVDLVRMGLATVPMAVTASSAFPGFFPPLELSAKDVGANEGEFSHHAFTDGGIYDNLGLRMFRYLQEVAVEPGEDGSPIELDGVFVSDAGASFKVFSERKAGGLLKTALRSSDILMDRVNQMELESFIDTPGAVFFPITRRVTQAQDPTAQHPEVQRQAALIRTDMDRFSSLELTSLVQHGYCVARQALREAQTIRLGDMPANPPWALPASTRGSTGRNSSSPGESERALADARKLQRSSSRRTLSTLFSFRDWPTYVWVPLLALLIFMLPYLIYQQRRTAAHQEHVLAAVAKSSPLYRDVVDLLRHGPAGTIPTISFEEVETVEPFDFAGYDVVTDDRIYDVRGWVRGRSPTFAPRMHARFRFQRTEEAVDSPQLRIQLPSTEDSMQVEYLPRLLRPAHVRARTDDGLYIYETSLDFSDVPVDSEQTLLVRQVLPDNMANQEFGVARFKFTIAATTGLVRIWVLLPEGRTHGDFELHRFPLDQPDVVELVEATAAVELPIGSIATFELINPTSGYRYECRWRWLDEGEEH
jgi:predicted acylesterase/phospholipase RssA